MLEKYITEAEVNNRLIIGTYYDGIIGCEKIYRVNDKPYEIFFMNGNYKFKDFENNIIKGPSSYRLCTV